jgi:hypothetical protein
LPNKDSRDGSFWRTFARSISGLLAEDIIAIDVTGLDSRPMHMLTND